MSQSAFPDQDAGGLIFCEHYIKDKRDFTSIVLVRVLSK